jgi:TolA-binding protein
MTAALGLVLALATGAHAAPPTVKVSIARAGGGGPLQPGAGDRAAARPELDAEQVLSIEALRFNIRPEQEQILTDLIANTPDNQVEEKSQYYFMLGELLTKLQRQWRQKGIELALQAARQKSPRAKAEAERAAEQAAKLRQKATKVYQALTGNEAFRNYPRMDMALFFYAYLLQSDGLMLEARQVFDKLLKDHPHSKYVPEAHLVFGEYYFEKGQLADAESRYKVVLKFPKATVYWYAMYKLGWIHLGQQRFQEALETFFQIAQATRNDKKQEGLNRAALKDFVRAYAEIGKADKAYPAFQRVDGQRALDMLQDLAALYLEQGKHDSAIYIYQVLIKAAPADRDSCPWQYGMARATAYTAGNAGLVEICEKDLEPLRAWARTSGAVVSCWNCLGAPTP